MQRFGRYEIIEEIGAGAMGTVYKAMDPMIDREVAIKTILTHAIDGPQSAEFRDRFFREARAAGRLAHPGIVTMYDVSEHEGTPFLVMEFIAGRNLQSVLQERQRMEMDTVFDVAIQLAEALDYAHKSGVIHRDIKPSNILLTRNGRVKIADFGVARLAESQMTFTGGQLLGTPAFMAPEQFTGVRIDGRADLFAAGVVLYWMATGDKPFTGETLLAVQYKVVNTDPVPPRVLNPAVSRGLEAVILKTLAKDPAERYQSGEKLADDLRAARANRAVSAKPATRPWDDTPTVVMPAPVPPSPPPAAPPAPAATSAASPAPREKRARAGRHNPVAFIAIVMLGVVLLRLISVMNTRVRPPAPSPTSSVAPSEPAPPPPIAKKTEAKKRPAAATPIPEKAPPVAKPETITLEVVAQDRSSVVFRAPEQPMQTVIMKAGDTMTFHAGKEAAVTISNAPALQLKLNGNTLSLGDHKSGQWMITPEGIDETRSAYARGAPRGGIPPIPAMPDISGIVNDAMPGRGGRPGVGSPAEQKALRESPGAARLHITSSSIPPFLTIIVRMDGDLLFRRDATVMPPPGRPDPASSPKMPISEERLLPPGDHKIQVTLMQDSRRFSQPQEVPVSFSPGQSRALVIELVTERGNPRLRVTVE